MLKAILSSLLKPRSRPDPEAFLAAYRLFQRGDLDGAEAACAALVRGGAQTADVRFLQAEIAHARGQIDAAIALYAEAIAARTSEGAFHLGLARALAEAGRQGDALRAYEDALPRVPQDADTQVALLLEIGRVYELAGELEKARARYAEAVELDPGSTQAANLLSLVQFTLGDAAGAKAAVQRCAALARGSGARIRLAIMTDMVVDSVADIDAARRRMDAALDELLEERLEPLEQPATAIGTLPFFLAYHGRSDRDLLAKLARVVRKVYAARTELARTPRRAGRLRVGFVSTFFWQHSVGRTFLSLARDLDHARFEVWVFSVAPRRDPVDAAYRASADHFVELAEDLDAARRAIEDAALDVLVYADLGMHPFTYFLALWRLAPVQMATWGHPTTSGIDTVDYYLSAEALETDRSPASYSETVLALPAFCGPGYARPASAGVRAARDALGLPATGPLFLSAQSVQKFHPEFDAALAGILAGDPHARIALVGHEGAAQARLAARLNRALGPLAARLHFLPRRSYAEYLACVAAADVVLDGFHFGGYNTANETFALGRPLVALPSMYLRNRWALALYREMGIDACIAASPQDYVRIALGLGANRDAREALARTIDERSPVLFGRLDYARALGEVLPGLVDRALAR